MNDRKPPEEMQDEISKSAFGIFLKFVKEVELVMYLSMTAIQHLQGLTQLTEVLIKVNEYRYQKDLEEDEKSKQIGWAKNLESLASRELEQGFPLLISHSVVAIWSALEAAIYHHITEWIQSYPSVLTSAKMERIRLPASAFELKGTEDFARLVVDEIGRTLNANLKPGVGRFEALLDFVGIDGGLDEQLRRDLFELSQVRNLIVHKFSIVDGRFKSSCPWIKTEIGQRLKISEDDFYKYYRASREYAASVLRRTGDQAKKIEAEKVR